LGVADVVFAVFKVDDQLVLTLCQLILLLLTAVQGATTGFIRTVTNQSTLGFIGPLPATFEKLEGDVGTILASGKLRQTQIDDIATAWVDCHIQYIGADSNQLGASLSFRQRARCLIAANGRDITLEIFGCSGCRRLGQLSRRGLFLAGFGWQRRLTIVLIP